MKYLKYQLFIILFFNFINGFGQDILNLEEAIEIGLKNNYSISIARNDSKIARNNNSLGNAGFLPSIAINANQTNNIYTIHQTYSDGTIDDASNSKTTLLNTGIILNWTLFNGFEMFINKNKLSELQRLGEIQFKLAVENTLSEITITYFSIVQQKKRLNVLKDALAFSNKRKDLALAKYKLGAASELAYFQSLVDLNADSAAFLKQESTFRNLKADLNNLLVRDITSKFEIQEYIGIDSVLNYPELVASTEKQNKQIIIAEKKKNISVLNYRLTHAPNYPKINFFAGYNSFNSDYSFGNVDVNRSKGPTIGFGLSYPIFKGFDNRRNSQNARIQVETDEFEYQQTMLDVNTGLYQLFNNYQNNLTLVQFETQNLETARKVTMIAFERYRLGEISDIDLRQIQVKQLESENRLLQAQFDAKELEVELKRISGLLLK